MSLRIANNLQALNTHGQLKTNAAAHSRSLERLSSGYRINRAADDAAGLSMSQGMRGQLGGLRQATLNGQDAISLLQTAEGALNEISNMLVRVRELAVQYHNGTLGLAERKAVQEEARQLAEEA